MLLSWVSLHVAGSLFAAGDLVVGRSHRQSSTGPGRGTSCLKVLVNSCEVSHDTLPVWTLCADHLVDVQRGFDANTLCCLKGKCEISSLVLVVELLVGDVGRQVGVQDGAERQTVVPAAAEVCDVDVLVSFGFLLAPLEQSVPLGAPILPGQR